VARQRAVIRTLQHSRQRRVDIANPITDSNSDGLIHKSQTIIIKDAVSLSFFSLFLKPIDYLLFCNGNAEEVPFHQCKIES
jgi:hypothetical protein